MLLDTQLGARTSPFSHHARGVFIGIEVPHVLPGNGGGERLLLREQGLQQIGIGMVVVAYGGAWVRGEPIAYRHSEFMGRIIRVGGAAPLGEHVLLHEIGGAGRRGKFAVERMAVLVHQAEAQ